MQNTDVIKGSSSLHTEHGGDSEKPHDLDAGGEDISKLQGAVSPPASEEAQSESEDGSDLAKEAPSRWLERWGLYKRWNSSRELRRYMRERDSYGRNTDKDNNLKSRLPEGESVQVPAVWVVELYTPSTIHGLLKGISDLGWDYGITRDESLLKWMNNVREGRTAGWISLGLVSSSDATIFMKERIAPLPPNVRAALPILTSLTPSLTAFIIVFLFDDETADSLVPHLRADFKTYTSPDPLFRPWHILRYILMGGPVRSGRRIHSPHFIRRDTVKACVESLEKDCVRWVTEHLPGAFASLPSSRTPTATLLVTEQVRPLSEDSRKISAFDGLALDRHYDAWESDEWPGARLVLPRSWDGEGNRLVFACRRHDAFPDVPGYLDPSSNWTISQRADTQIQGLLSRWAISCLLDRYHEVLSALRDQTAHEGGYRPIRDLKELRSLARTTLYDIDACTQEIVEFTESDLNYLYDVMEMTYVQSEHGGQSKLLDNLRYSQGKRAKQVRREASLLLSTLSTSNNLSQTISNIRVQRLVVLLTLVSMGIALGAAFLTFRGL